MPEETPSKRMARAVGIYKELRNRIDSGGFKVGDYLPSERSLIGEFKASRPTVRKALQRLEREGCLVCHAGIGYEVVGANARRRGDGSEMVGVLWSPGGRSGYPDPWLPRLEAALSSRGYAMLLGFTGRELGAENQRVAAFTERGVAGMIALPAERGKGRSLLGELVAEGFPVVAVGEPGRWCMSRKAAASCSYVDIDNSLGSQLALDRLHQLGHRRVAFAHDGMNRLMSRRERGYRDWMAEMDLAVPEGWVISCRRGGPEATREHLRELLSSTGAGPTAILCATADDAVRVSSALEELGVPVPGGVSLVAFFAGIRNEPPVQGRALAGLGYSWDDAVTEIIAALVSQIGNRSVVRRTLLRPEFIEGETVAPPAEVQLRESR